jgi:hypothetical protein
MKYQATYSLNGDYTCQEFGTESIEYFFGEGDEQTVVGDSFSDAVAKCEALGKEPLFLIPLGE